MTSVRKRRRSTPSQSVERRWERTGSRKSSPRMRADREIEDTSSLASVDLPAPANPEMPTTMRGRSRRSCSTAPRIASSGSISSSYEGRQVKLARRPVPRCYPNASASAGTSGIRQQDGFGGAPLGRVPRATCRWIHPVDGGLNSTGRTIRARGRSTRPPHPAAFRTHRAWPRPPAVPAPHHPRRRPARALGRPRRPPAYLRP